MSKSTILVVEDHRPLLMGIRDILETAGYSTFIASNGVEALEVMEQTLPDLIVADIMMPALDGYGLYERVRNHPDWSSIPVIFLTSKAEQEDILRSEALGVDGYITKPFDPNELLVMLRTLLAQQEEKLD